MMLPTATHASSTVHAGAVLPDKSRGTVMEDSTAIGIAFGCVATAAALVGLVIGWRQLQVAKTRIQILTQRARPPPYEADANGRAEQQGAPRGSMGRLVDTIRIIL